MNHCVKSVRIRSFSSPYSVQMRENTVQKTPNTDPFRAVNFIVIFTGLQMFFLQYK